MSANPDSVGKQGQFHSSVPPAKPLMTSGHKLGEPVSKESDTAEFRAKTFPPGTAPKEHTHKPNPIHEIPGQALNPDADPQYGRTGALDMPGATSQEIYADSAFARPMQGQTTTDDQVKKRGGLEGVGVTDTRSDDTVEGRARGLGADLPEGVERGMRGKEQGPGAEELKPVPAEEVAAKRRT